MVQYLLRLGKVKTCACPGPEKKNLPATGENSFLIAPKISKVNIALFSSLRLEEGRGKIGHNIGAGLLVGIVL